MEDDREQIQRWLAELYRHQQTVTQIDAVVRAESFDLPAEAMEVVAGLPSGLYTRGRLCDQINSAIVARGLSRRLGTHD